jgi:hypothetical protein
LKYKGPDDFYYLQQKAKGKELSEALVHSFLLVPGMAEVKKIFDSLPKNWSTMTRLGTALERFAEPEDKKDFVQTVEVGMGLMLPTLKSYIIVDLRTNVGELRLTVARKANRFTSADQKFAKEQNWELVEELDSDW